MKIELNKAYGDRVYTLYRIHLFSIYALLLVVCFFVFELILIGALLMGLLLLLILITRLFLEKIKNNSRVKLELSENTVKIDYVNIEKHTQINTIDKVAVFFDSYQGGVSLSLWEQTGYNRLRIIDKNNSIYNFVFQINSKMEFKKYLEMFTKIKKSTTYEVIIIKKLLL